MKTCCLPILFFLLASLTAVANVSAGTTTVTTTITTTTNAICGSMATGVSSSILTNCRRRRQYWIDVPAYIALNDDVDSQLVQYFNPTKTYQVEPTVWPFKSNRQPIDYHPVSWLGSFFPTPYDVIQPSVSSVMSATDVEQKGLKIGLTALIALIKGVLGSIIPSGNTSDVTETSTKTETVMSSTKTIFVSGCKPVPFPFSTCQ